MPEDSKDKLEEVADSYLEPEAEGTVEKNTGEGQSAESENRQKTGGEAGSSKSEGKEDKEITEAKKEALEAVERREQPKQSGENKSNSKGPGSKPKGKKGGKNKDDEKEKTEVVKGLDDFIAENKFTKKPGIFSRLWGKLTLKNWRLNRRAEKYKMKDMELRSNVKRMEEDKKGLQENIKRLEEALSGGLSGSDKKRKDRDLKRQQDLLSNIDKTIEANKKKINDIAPDLDGAVDILLLPLMNRVKEAQKNWEELKKDKKEKEEEIKKKEKEANDMFAKHTELSKKIKGSKIPQEQKVLKKELSILEKDKRNLAIERGELAAGLQAFNVSVYDAERRYKELKKRWDGLWALRSEQSKDQPTG